MSQDSDDISAVKHRFAKSEDPLSPAKLKLITQLGSELLDQGLADSLEQAAYMASVVHADELSLRDKLTCILIAIKGGPNLEPVSMDEEDLEREVDAAADFLLLLKSGVAGSA